ncbi:response regulator transcription factor [Oceanirhabdus sp. W0125-5]|uniref:response regulator transcription factor n=1 Tax=Oceanirhabdus sp. W0125-5 TaxID=2999116 RepID=UPI0022F2FB33|nr:response regulator transcription factor [Oceanirhabdus sp. W0125-5]WBW98394.1 response regulator transcription factor [Oceanirhabdus sp. W0125-5]
MESIKVLIIEDNKSLNRGITFKLKREGYDVRSAENISEARKIFEGEELQLIISDVDLPDGCGFDFCEEVRKKSDVLIIFLTASDSEVDIVTGLDMGADDYITKPFSLTVLTSRINALFRRNMVKKQSDGIVSGELRFNQKELKLMKGNCEIPLSKTEIKIIGYFLDNPMQILTKEQILHEMWDINGEFVNENALAVNIKRIREKIEDTPRDPQYIKTVRGIGYIWNRKCRYN